MSPLKIFKDIKHKAYSAVGAVRTEAVIADKERSMQREKLQREEMSKMVWEEERKVLLSRI